MTDLLSPEDLVSIKSAIQDVMDTFAKKLVYIRKRTPALASFGEVIAEGTPVDHPIHIIYEPSKGFNGRYTTVESSQKGEEWHDGWRVYVWADEVSALGIEIDPETDKVVIDGKAYQIKMFTPSAQFSDLGNLLYEFEVHFNK